MGEDHDFFFQDISSDYQPGETSGDDVGLNSLNASSSAPTLRKYTSRDGQYGFDVDRGNMLSFRSLTPSLSHPFRNSATTKGPKLEVSDFLGTERPPHSIDFADLDNMEKILVGRNSLLYKATYHAEAVAVKVMMPGLENNIPVQAEFDMEQHLLSSLNHPNLVRFIGCGLVDPCAKLKQPFTVLEWLDSSLQEVTILKSKRAFLPKAFSNSSASSFPDVLPILLQICSVLRYLHGEVSHKFEKIGKLEIIHRALIPEHFRYNGDPQSGVKLISFMSCHLTFRHHKNDFSRESSKHDYCASPNHSTTDLCYTPPEVAMRLSISTKSDSYAFALLCWQLMKGKKPFPGMNKTEFMSKVVYKGKRPKISRSWSAAFSSILEACWLSNPVERPPMHTVYDQLDHCFQAVQHKSWQQLDKCY